MRSVTQEGESLQDVIEKKNNLRKGDTMEDRQSRDGSELGPAGRSHGERGGPKRRGCFQGHHQGNENVKQNLKRL